MKRSDDYFEDLADLDDIAGRNTGNLVRDGDVDREAGINLDGGTVLDSGVVDLDRVIEAGGDGHHQFLLESGAGYADHHLGSDGLRGDIVGQGGIIGLLEGDAGQLGQFIVLLDDDGVAGIHCGDFVSEGNLGAVGDSDGGFPAGRLRAADGDDIMLSRSEDRRETVCGDRSGDDQGDGLGRGVDGTEDIGRQVAVETGGEIEAGQFALSVRRFFRLAGDQDRNGCHEAGCD